MTKQRRGHHSAIVAANRGNVFEVFEQNVKPRGKVVQRNQVAIAGSGPDTKTESRNAKDGKGKVRPAQVVETTTTVVRGFIWAYRPRATP